MKEVKDITALVYDYGNSVDVAQRLARDYKKVYYYCEWQTGFPTWNKMAIGLDVPGIERVDHWAEVIDECDLVVFPDLYQAALQDWLVAKGMPVFGARQGELMETMRDDFKEILKSAGLPVNPHKVHYGYTALENYLSKNDNQYVKMSVIRGNGETFHYKNKRLSQSRMDKLKHNLGAYKEHAVFVTEEPIPDAIEIGYDGYCIDGKYPDRCLAGIEVKDAGYCGEVIPYSDLAPVLKDINKKLAGIFAGAGYKCFWSNEVRWDGKVGYLIDPTNRRADPPGALQQEIFKDYSAYVWEVANGIVPEIEAVKKFGAQIIIKSEWAYHEPQAVYFPAKYANRVKIKNLMYKDGIAHYIPCDYEMMEIGSVVGLGDTLDEAIEDAKMIAEQIEGDSIVINGGALDAAKEEIKKMAKFGIKMIDV